MPTDIPALIERLIVLKRLLASDKMEVHPGWDRIGATVALVDAATALAEQAAEIKRLRASDQRHINALSLTLKNNERGRAERATLRAQLAEAREVLVDIAHMAGDEKPNPKDYDGYHGCRVLGFNEGAWQAAQIARQWLASTEKQG